ncbi:ExeM/NucH family extracellular endonuclease [Kocuria sp. p3-SID1433]|uniref:ExeM/NucH family extracellular endonuclease n=1 Tax=unclassified Kocuria TaxID=2649579 RepID=UPI0021A75126|nr:MULTISPECIES: ExeM/NucH family extracellular endonuclease [unclassified Kocuria]MCT1601351.1 ExeM/NucH family extracellular endonuclease [Kocuria sp. p3-SID1428]MCT2180182.1 ExeM/NucH family extracellular endonuclease [Kocuria sp. p3-SID1433]
MTALKTPQHRTGRLRSAALPLAALLAIPAGLSSLAPASASPAGDEVVINEAYLSGGSANAVYTHKFVELYNPSDAPVSLDGWSLQYRSATGTSGTSNTVPLSGTIQPGEHFLVSGASNGTNGAALPEADVEAGGRLNPSGTKGTLVLSSGGTALSLPTGSITEATPGTESVVDLLGYGDSNTFETAGATSPSSNADPRSMNRSDAADTDDNSADFSLSSQVTPQSGDGSETPDPEPTPEPTEPGEQLSIAEIQGEADTTPYQGQQVTTRGVVTAAYKTGGLNGYQIQTEGTGGDLAADHDASDGIFVYAPEALDAAQIGDHVEVTGTADEYYGQTQISVPANGIEVLGELAEAVKPADVAWPTDEESREDLEGMLLQPTGEFTVSDNYSLNSYGEVGLAVGETPLRTPTDAAPAGSAEAAAVEADNAARGVLLDDGSTWNYTNLQRYGDQPLPYLSQESPVRVGSSVSFDQPVVLGYGHDAWRLQPLEQVTGETPEAVPALFENDRSEYAAPAPVGGDYTLGTFNVLNYFTSLGADEPGCRAHLDRAGNPTTADYCDVRGAYDQDSFAQQQEKIVAAINGLDSSVVSLEEIENSAAFGKDRDQALSALVEALNADAGSQKWAYVPSPSELPASEDVIRTGFIYQPAEVETVGESAIHDDQENFDNAREPLAQTFRPVGGTETDDFVVVVNHLKSKGGSGSGDNTDTGQGSWNGDRTRQAESMQGFAESFAQEAGTDRLFLVGDFNSYTHEDPMLGLYADGYVNLAPEGQHTYSYGGQSGSLDHVLASPAAAEAVTGSDIWEINANESVGMEYSRANYNVVDLYAPDQFRASDHNPALVGIALSGSEEPSPEPTDPTDPTDPSPEPSPEPTDQPTFGHGHDLAEERKSERGRPSGDLREWVQQQRDRFTSTR